MRTQTPRIRQLTFPLERAPCVPSPRAAAATAPSHPLSAGRSRNSFILVGGVTAEKANRLRFLPGPRSGVTAPET
jgi:hypothetical protein